MSNQYINLFACECKFDSDWRKSINHDSNAIAVIKQMHSFTPMQHISNMLMEKIDNVNSIFFVKSLTLPL